MDNKWAEKDRRHIHFLLWRQLTEPHSIWRRGDGCEVSLIDCVSEPFIQMAASDEIDANTNTFHEILPETRFPDLIQFI